MSLQILVPRHKQFAQVEKGTVALMDFPSLPLQPGWLSLKQLIVLGKLSFYFPPPKQSHKGAGRNLHVPLRWCCVFNPGCCFFFPSLVPGYLGSPGVRQALGFTFLTSLSFLCTPSFILPLFLAGSLEDCISFPGSGCRDAWDFGGLFPAGGVLPASVCCPVCYALQELHPGSFCSSLLPACFWVRGEMAGIGQNPPGTV